MSSLQVKAISGVKWNTLRTVVVFGTALVIQIIKARFLSHEEFAYIAVIFIVIGFFTAVDNLGINSAIIQKDTINVKETSSLLYFTIVLAALWGIILYFLAPVVAGIFSMPPLEYYLKMTSLVIIIERLAFFFNQFLYKYFFFKEVSLIEITGNIIKLGGITFFLFSGFGVLSIVYGYILFTIVKMLAVIICFKYKIVSIQLYFNPQIILPFLKFGSYVSARNLMDSLTYRIDEIVIGYFLAPEILGIYFFGKNMLERFRELFVASFQNLLFPIFSRLKKDHQKLSMAYRRISLYVALVSFPVFTGIALTAHLFVPVIFGTQWSDSIIVFQVFALALILNTVVSNMASLLLYAAYKPALVFFVEMIVNFLYFLFLLLAMQGEANQLTNVLVIYCGYIVIKAIILQIYANKQLYFNFLQYLANFKNVALAAFLMALGVLLFLTGTSFFLSKTLQLISSIILGMSLYILITLHLEKRVAFDFIKSLKSSS